MINTTFFAGLRRRWLAYDQERREIIGISSDVLALSKQAIFAFHRNDVAEGKTLLAKADTHLAALAKRFKKTHGLSDEGSYRAALEEYAEARIFYTFLLKQKIGAVEAPAIDDDAVLGGLLDFTGEAVRYAVRMATAGNEPEVIRAHQAVEAVASEVMRMNLTGSLRQKYDQLKINLRKFEEMRYDLSLRRRP